MKRIARFCTLMLVLAMMLSLTTTAFATGKVTYDGTANQFFFAPGTKESVTNLFSEFQTVMPGDTITDQIVIQNDSAKNVKIKVYLRSQGAQLDTDELLSQMKLTVKQNGNSVLYAAPAHKVAQLADWVYLGTVYSGGNIKLDLTLEVPITMGNEFQEEAGYIDWEFKVEELPVDPNDPKTGDTSDVFVYAAVLAGSVVAAILVLILIKRRKQSDEE